MKMLVEAWAGWVMVLAFDLWRYPDIVMRERTGRSPLD